MITMERETETVGELDDYFAAARAEMAAAGGPIWRLLGFASMAGSAAVSSATMVLLYRACRLLVG